jgi:hypothetical protein
MGLAVADGGEDGRVFLIKLRDRQSIDIQVAGLIDNPLCVLSATSAPLRFDPPGQTI